ncbi:uncharacterized protein LOC113576118 isoform X1 [Electrophorus electricus]|uniref:uncharacterized protein LOC113576118 isoform X1 n=2 Tax=Electrophorus electricus TaxID=8005 RepID=UPI0015D06A72|nr:uncharacterized protein LOC113576118 isoform X1 [Electrophorus electricus]
MESRPEMSLDLDIGIRQTVKAHLLASQKLLVPSLYNLAPLLDSALAVGILSQDNYQEIKAEKTPQNSARKLLEIVHGQMDESEATRFLQCLKECKQHYPRLRPWLSAHSDIPRGPTERQLQADFSALCSRLGSSVLPVSLALFSSSTLTQFDLERIQASPTPTQQAQILLATCLTKGETACRNFYTALYSEDQQLAEDMNVSNLVKDLSLSNDYEVSNIAMGVEETRDQEGGLLPQSSVLQQVSTRLGVSVDTNARLNVCELGVALGLPRRDVRECLLEGVSIEDMPQLEALVSLFMEKTEDVERLLSRVAELDIKRVQLSERGCLSLKLLQEAEALLRRGSHSHLHSWDPLHDQDHLHGPERLHVGDCRDQCMVWAVFSFLVGDCLAEALEEPELKPSDSLAGMLRQLRGCEWIEAALLQEAEQCWTEGGQENLLQSVRVLAQILRDLHPLQHDLRLSAPAEGVYSCRPSRLHRVTSFQGLSARIIRKALSSMVPASSRQDETPYAPQYRDVCICVAQLLDKVESEVGTGELTNAPVAQVTKCIRLLLSRPAFNSQAFDAGVRYRLLSLAEFSSAQLGLGLGPLAQLHQETLFSLQYHLQPGEHHSFHLYPESVRMLGPSQPRLLSVLSTRGPVAIDNGVEEDFSFKTSEATSFLVQLRCLRYEAGKGRLEVREPCCVLACHLREEGSRAVRWLAVDILGEEDDKMWVREGGGSRWREELADVVQRHSAKLQEEGCCFRVTSSEPLCKVRFSCRGGRLWATPLGGCEVL